MTYSEKMLQALQNEDLAEAQLSLEEALKKDDDAILAELGEELLAIGFLEEAKAVFITLTERQPSEDAYNLPLAEIAIENNEMEEAFEYLEAIPKSSETYPQALLITADLYQVLGIPEVSEAKLKEAAQLLPEENLIQFALAELYFSMDKFVEAEQIYRKLLQDETLDVTGISLVERIGSSLSMQGKFEEAVLFLEEALEDEQTDDRLFQTAFVYLQLKENEKAIYYLQQLRAMNPQYQALYLYLAEALQEEELLEEAQAVIEEGIQENPYQVDFYHFASENSYRLHDVKKAEDYLVKALETGEKVDETLLTLSNLYLNEEMFDEVIDAISRMEDQENPYALWNLAHAYNELEEFDSATKYYEEANIALNHEPEFMKEYGIFLREEGRLEEARQLLSHYLAHEPGDLEVQSILDDLSER
ncbi:MAG TPA: tetratricopeptide repeat protein [Enterococcus sp.]|nr:tetratricopeptide repeat protein [Enterococcus sp.]